MKKTYGTMYYVDDMKASVAWFARLLKAKPRYASAEWSEFAVGAHALCLHAKGKGTRHRPNGVLIVSVDGVKKLFETLKKRRLGVSGLHEVHPGAWTFDLEDPSGNQLSFYGAP